MNVPYRAVQWTRKKLLFDLALVSGAFLYLAVFVAVSLGSQWTPDYVEAGTVAARAFGTLAIILFHGVLLIGPLARLNPSFLALLPHRRHAGVFVFLVALVHGILATVLHHSGGPLNPLASILFGNLELLSIRAFPFAIFGFLALVLLAILAVTSHDFWIEYLSFPLWKHTQMLVYGAYGLVILHVGLGVLQESANPVYLIALALGLSAVVLAHTRAAAQEHRFDHQTPVLDDTGHVRVCRPEEIPFEKAVVVSAGGERVAVFRHWRGVSAISDVCPHQGGPLGEGSMSGGCVRCPWHGSMFFPETGLAPPPGANRVPTYNLKLSGGYLYVNPNPNPPGLSVPPLAIPGSRWKGDLSTNAPRLESGVLSPRRREDL